MDSRLQLVIPNLKKILEKQSYLNLKHIQFSSKSKLIEIANIINNATYRFFRIIYMKNEHIVGENIIGISYLPYRHFEINQKAKIKSERYVYKLIEQMKLLKADSYYIVHNSNLKNHFVFSSDIETTRFFYENMKGLIGHLIINSNKYYWLYIKNNKVIISNEKYIKNLFFNNLIKRKYKSIKVLATYIYQKQINLNKSTILLTNLEDTIEMIIDIPNKYLKKSCAEKYIKNYNKDFKSFLITDNEDIFEINNSDIKQKILYKNLSGKLFFEEK